MFKKREILLKPIATINGVHVYSDKRLTRIDDNHIQFADGSYANVATMAIVNKGKGYITIGSCPEGSMNGQPVTKTEKFKASKLSLVDVGANVDIQPEGSEIIVVVTGDKPSVDGITFRKEPDQVIVMGHGRSDTHVNHVFSEINTSGSVSISNNSIGCGNQGAKMTIKVPVGTALDISNVSGDTNIGDIRGTLVLRQKGQNKARVGNVLSSRLFTSGQSKIAVTDVRGELHAEPSDQSRISVTGGRVDKLVAKVSEQSAFTYDGIALNAELTGSGSGKFEIADVHHGLTAKVFGQRHIKVPNIKVENLTVETSGQSGFSCGGLAKNANLIACGQSKIDVEHVTNLPIRSCSGQAKIKIRNQDW